MDTSTGVLNILRTLKRKYERDYLSFFTGLSEQYSGGPINQLISRGIRETRKLTGLISSALETKKLSAQAEREITDLGESIDSIRLELADRAASTNSLRRRMMRVEERTGLTEQDLNVSQDIISTGIKQFRRQTAGGGRGFSSRFPSVSRAASGFGQDVVSSVLGPFSQFVNPVLRDVGQARRSGASAVSRREADISSRIQPVGVNIPVGPQSNVGPMVTTPLGGPVRQAHDPGGGKKKTREESVAPLVMFYDREAYRTRWTRDLLDSVRKSSDSRVSGFSRLSRNLGGLSKAILPFIGKAGLFAALAGATTLAVRNTLGVVSEVKKTVPAVVDAIKSWKTAQRMSDELQAQLAEKSKSLRDDVFLAGGLDEFSSQSGKTPQEVARADAHRERRLALMDAEDRAKSRIKKNMMLGPILGTLLTDFQSRRGKLVTGVPKVSEFEDRVKEIEAELSNLSLEHTRLSAVPLAQPADPADVSSRDILNALERINRTMEDQRSGEGVGLQTVRNPHDSGDDIVNSVSRGQVGLGD